MLSWFSFAVTKFLVQKDLQVGKGNTQGDIIADALKILFAGQKFILVFLDCIEVLEAVETGLFFLPGRNNSD